MTVVSRKGNGKNILLVSNETTSSLPGANVPQTEFRVPRSRKGELSITGDDDITHEVRVSAKRTAGKAIVAGSVGVGQLPHNDALVTRRRQQKVGVFWGGSEGGDPVAVSFESSAGSYFYFSHGFKLNYCNVLCIVLDTAMYFFVDIMFTFTALLVPFDWFDYRTGSRGS